ncbi:unnamed protein product [Paramecium primaurelia]|uniref:Uncharacterized protein n=1 Tax=Paramecium primaurelia TaxID=5886 RepID=A0A8S1QEX3_PARPR|nr:unnamed protein product [Paramecium primaurelia]
MISFTFYNPNLLVKDFILQFSKNFITYNSQLSVLQLNQHQHSNLDLPNQRGIFQIYLDHLQSELLEDSKFQGKKFKRLFFVFYTTTIIDFTQKNLQFKLVQHYYKRVQNNQNNIKYYFWHKFLNIKQSIFYTKKQRQKD